MRSEPREAPGADAGCVTNCPQETDVAASAHGSSFTVELASAGPDCSGISCEN